MVITDVQWQWFIQKLKSLDDAAAREISQFVIKQNLYDPASRTYTLTDDVIQYAYGIATKYGEASSALTAEMYDRIAELSSVMVPQAIPAPTSGFYEVERNIRAAYAQSQRIETLGATTGRMVKQAGQDTLLQNAKRDGAEVAWIPSGDTCAFCVSLASRGWREVSNGMIKLGHAEHIHSNCDCSYGVRFDGLSGVSGYNPAEYLEMYYGAPLDGQNPTAKNRINAMRRAAYAKNKEEINAQKRDAYAKRKERESSSAEEINLNT